VGRAETTRDLDAVAPDVRQTPPWPFGGIDWTTVGAETVARQRQGGTGKMLRERGAEIFRPRPDLAKKLLG